MEDVERHNREIQENLNFWKQKPLLGLIYKSFHEKIAQYLSVRSTGCTVELGSGIPDIRQVIPDCIRTDLFPNPWIDSVENAYALSFKDGAASNVILFDVFHHLRYPGTALREFHRVLSEGGRLLIFDPCISLLGLLVYGSFHQEPIAMNQEIRWTAPPEWSPGNIDYYAAQGNATRIFLHKEFDIASAGWSIVAIRRFSAISYVASGGYSRSQLYPDRAFPLLRLTDRICDFFPGVFATRLLVVLEKSGNSVETPPAAQH